MYSLRILGPAELTGDTGASIQSVLNQPKRLALLAYLAVAPAGRRSRTEVLGTFWGDQDDEKARHALSQALYYLRRSLGKDAVVADGESLFLDPEVVECDAVAFRRHLEAGRLNEAVALYRGDLLEGFTGTGAGEFDRWLDGAREAVRRQTVDACERLSLDAEAQGDAAAAVQWAERAHQAAPYHEAPVRRLMAALLADAQPVRARETYERFARLIRDELEVEPSPDTAALLERPQPTPGPTPVPDAATRPVPPARPLDAVPPPPSAAMVRRRWRRARWLLPALAAAALVVVLGRWAYTDATGDPLADASSGRIGVFPFVYRGHADLAYLGEGIPELISISIRSLDRVTTLDPRALVSRAAADRIEEPSVIEASGRARALGADHFVVGSVVEAGGQIQVTARLHRADGELVATVSGRAPGEDALFELVDDLVRQLVASEAFPGPSDLERAAALTTGSLPALRDFLGGEALFRQGRFPEASRAFDAAVAQDSTFALALYRGAVASIWSDDADFDGARRRVARALRYQDRVSPLEAELFLALDEFLHGRMLTAERLYESVLLQQPENIEAWFQLAEVRFHYGALHGRSVLESGAAWEHVLELNADHRPGLIHMAAIAALRHDPVLTDIERRVNAGGEQSVLTPQIRALAVFTTGSAEDQEAFLRDLRRYRASAVAGTAAYASRYLRSPAVGARVARVLTERARPALEQAEGHLLLTQFELASGRPAAARREFLRAQQLGAPAAEVHRLLLATLPEAPVVLRTADGAVMDAMPRLALEANPGGPVAFDGGLDSGLLFYARALAYHRAGGEEGAVLSAARRLAETPAADGGGSFLGALARGLTAERDLSSGDSAAARSELDAAVLGVERWYEQLRESHLRSLARERFLLAATEAAQGNPARAEGLLRAFGDNAVSELPYLVPSLVRVGEIREQAGDAAGAAAAYREALLLWSEAEPDLAPLLVELESRIAALASSLPGPGSQR